MSFLEYWRAYKFGDNFFYKFIFYFPGSRVNSRESPDPTGDTFETMSIPPPGVPREIPELNQAVVDSLQEVMDEGRL